MVSSQTFGPLPSLTALESLILLFLRITFWILLVYLIVQIHLVRGFAHNFILSHRKVSL